MYVSYFLFHVSVATAVCVAVCVPLLSLNHNSYKTSSFGQDPSLQHNPLPKNSFDALCVWVSVCDAVFVPEAQVLVCVGGKALSGIPFFVLMMAFSTRSDTPNGAGQPN